MYTFVQIVQFSFQMRLSIQRLALGADLFHYLQCNKKAVCNSNAINRSQWKMTVEVPVDKSLKCTD